jgi:hypothetical protein
LEGWWLRSQSDFTAGAGGTFMEPVSDEYVVRQVQQSIGLDVWTPGEVHLLNQMDTLHSPGATVYDLTLVSSGGTEYLFYRSGSSVYRDSTAVTGWTNTPTMLASAGSKILAAHSGGVDVLSSPFTTPASLWTGAASAPQVWWVKQRIIAAIGPALYELSLAGGAWPSALYTHPNADWVWTSVVETGTAILAAGYAGSKSAVYKFTLDTSGALPTLSKAVTAAELPDGETVTGMFAYLGFVVLGTSQGVRVAQVGDDGNLVYGPLSFESAYSIKWFAARDRFVWFWYSDIPQATVTSDLSGSGTVRLDLSQDDGKGRYPWAFDVISNAFVATNGGTRESNGGLVIRADGRVVLSSGSTVRQEDTTERTSNGLLRTGLVRFNTLEPKMFRSLRVRGSIDGGGLIVWSAADGAERTVQTLTTETGFGEVLPLALDDPVERCGLIFEFRRGGSGSFSGAATDDGPVLSGWQLRAMPAVERQQVLVVPLACFDVETDKIGNRVGGEGQALARFQALVDAVDGGSVVTYQDLNTGERLTVVVEDLQFRQTTPAGQHEGFGGIINVRLRTV